MIGTAQQSMDFEMIIALIGCGRFVLLRMCMELQR